jgi:hypothetical protein
MLENAFIGKTTSPTATDVGGALGPAKGSWDRLLADLAAELGADVHEWKSYSPKAGWSLRVLRKKRTIVWLSPGNGCFEVVFILGGRAMEAARAAKLPKSVLQALETAPKYAEGTGVRLTVSSPRNLAVLKQLAAIKVEH